MFFLFLHSAASDLHFPLFGFTPVFLYSLYCLQPAAPRLPFSSLFAITPFFLPLLPPLSVRRPVPAETSPSFLLNISEAFDPTLLIFQHVISASAAAGGSAAVAGGEAGWGGLPVFRGGKKWPLRHLILSVPVWQVSVLMLMNTSILAAAAGPGVGVRGGWGGWGGGADRPIHQWSDGGAAGSAPSSSVHSADRPTPVPTTGLSSYVSITC